MEHNADNIDKLSHFVVDNMELSALIEYARVQLVNEYDRNEELFNEDWQIWMEHEDG